MMAKRLVVLGLLVAVALAWTLPAAAGPMKWVKGKGWGWVWGPDDEIGTLNELNPEVTLAAARLITTGKVYGLGQVVDRTTPRWPGHNPFELISFRSPGGVTRQLDFPFVKPEVNTTNTLWHSALIIVSDNLGTQIDLLSHITMGQDNHWYNGFTEDKHGGDFGVLKAGADKTPPIVARGVLIDLAACKGISELPAGYAVSSADLRECLARQGTQLKPLDVVLIRHGSGKHWGVDNTKFTANNGGITLEAAKWLVEQNGTIAIGNDTIAFEVAAPAGAGTFIPVHNYLLIEQGVYILEYLNLEGLSQDRAYEFMFVLGVNPFRGAVAGTVLQPIAIR
jgi:kynurenine formamidase